MSDGRVCPQRGAGYGEKRCVSAPGTARRFGYGERVPAAVDAGVAGRVTEQDLPGRGRWPSGWNAEAVRIDEKRRARMNGIMIQALLTHSQADCRTLRSTEIVARRSLVQLLRVRSAVAAACGT